MPGSGLKTGFVATDEITVSAEVLEGFLGQLPKDLRDKLTSARTGSPHQPGALQLQAALILGLQGIVLADLVGPGASGKRRRGRPRKGEQPPKPAGPPERRLALDVAVKVSGELRRLQRSLLELRPEGDAPRTGTYHWKDPIRVKRDEEGRAHYAGPSAHPETKSADVLQAELDAMLHKETADWEARNSEAPDAAGPATDDGGASSGAPEDGRGDAGDDGKKPPRRNRRNRGRKRADRAAGPTVLQPPKPTRKPGGSGS